jgi:hypothetical protein
MRRRTRIGLLVGLAILLLLLAGRESYHFYRELRQLELPTDETREPFGRNVHSWMNAEEMAHFYKVPVEEIFTTLGIQSSPGDEKLTLKELADKYHKSPTEIQNALNALNNQVPNRGANRHD